MAERQYDCVLNIAQCHQLLIYSISRLCIRHVVSGRNIRMDNHSKSKRKHLAPPNFFINGEFSPANTRQVTGTDKKNKKAN